MTNKRFLGWLLFLLLTAVYLLTYRGQPISGDEVFIYDSAESLARRGDMYRTYEYHQSAGPQFRLKPGPNGEPWLEPIQEPIAVILAVPLIWLGQSLPTVGTMHVVWLFNVLMTALVAVSLYVIGLWQGYSVRTAWLGALLYGLSTIAWSYSRYLFREPTTAFFVLWAFACAIHLRQSKRFSLPIGLLLVGCFIGAFFTKTVTILLLPSLLIVLLPSLNGLQRQWKMLLGLGIVGLAGVGVVLLLLNSGVVGGRYSIQGWFERMRHADWDYIGESVLGYQISPARSIWLYSPILLMGWWGVWLLLKRGDWRVVMALVMGFLGLSMWYGFSFTLDWSGGWGWGPRYFLPLIPLLMLWVLPAIEQSRRYWQYLLIATLALLGGAIQVLGMLVRLSDYYVDLFRAGKLYDYDAFRANSRPFIETWHWMDGNWTWQWSPLRYHIQNLRLERLDLVWRVADPQGFALGVLVVFVVISALVAYQNLYRKPQQGRMAVVYAGLAPCFLSICVGLMLYSLRNDPRYFIEVPPEVRTLIEHLDEVALSDDAIFIDRSQYTGAFMNYFKTPALVVTLPYAPGENYGGGATIGSDQPLAAQAGRQAVYALDWTADRYQRLWLVVSSSQFEPDKSRPIEHYLAVHYFPISAIEISYRARAISYLTTDAPLDQAPTIPSDVVFGKQLRLIGYDLPAGTTITTPNGIAVSLLWEPITPLERDYTVGIYLLDSSGSPVAQRDGVPQGTFGLTSTWQPNQTYRDNHGLWISKDVPTGDYQLIMAVYYWEDRQRLAVGDGDTLTLATITVAR